MIPHLIKADIAAFAKAQNQRAQEGGEKGAAGEGAGGEAGEGIGDRRQHAVGGGGVLAAQECVEAVEVGQRTGGQRKGAGGGHGAAGSPARAADHWRRAPRVWPRPSRSNAASRDSARRSSVSGMIGAGSAVFIPKG